ncbi:MAG: hypothetical protein JWR02_800 [Mucilaginibacter sp.]|nr:hypothetical protein [Mucilaginibacter sp.]
MRISVHINSIRRCISASNIGWINDEIYSFAVTGTITSSASSIADWYRFANKNQ